MRSRRRRYNPETGQMEYYTLQTKNELNAKKRERYKDNKDANSDDDGSDYSNDEVKE